MEMLLILPWAALAFACLGVFALAKGLYDAIKRKEKQERDRIKGVILTAAKFCRERPLKKIPRKVRERHLASQRRLEKLWAREFYFKKS
jgi:hypothetical protein